MTSASPGKTFPAPPAYRERAYVQSLEQYRRLYAESVKDPERFWAEQAKRLDWQKPWDKVLDWNFTEPRIEWFPGGKLNASVNCLDRHVAAGKGGQTAIIWEGNEPTESRSWTYAELHREVCRFANALLSLGVKKGDRVCLYLPMVIELPIALLACARIGAVHSVVFGGFSAESLKSRILDSSCSVVITANEAVRGKKTIPLKATTDAALEGVDCVQRVIVVERTPTRVPLQAGRDVMWNDVVRGMPDTCAPAAQDAEDPLFILYTSGSTGKPKGVLHTTGGYLLHVSLTHHYVFDYRPGDVFWCTADIGWVTGHSYIVYGPLSNAATSVMFEGIPNYPDYDRFWQVVEKHGVNILYTAPTAIRALMREGTSHTDRHPMKSLRLLGTVGEPINPEAWLWYHKNVGKDRCPIVDTWWQTETGGILISPLPGAIDQKPGSATLPFFGVQPVLMNEKGAPLPDGTAGSGNLCIRAPWPGMMRTVYGDHQRFRETYFSQYPGYYFTGDGCRRDEDGYYWITGRVDDVINVSGHRIGTAEVESALVGHTSVAEAAVVGMPHEIKGQGIYAFVTLKSGVEPTEELRKVLVQHVRKEIGAHASPDEIQFTPALPKTRSGKILRRILRKIASGDAKDLGDTTTLADPTVIDSLVRKE
ncbi:MAG TPA: acetate--CoA ligase [Planctomycetota bacterium]|jgi:acetyl-CoA synthetase|nr:acetate--CoA ligase [Planctomycetota bacterium]